jgi:phosphate acetyltransferase
LSELLNTPPVLSKYDRLIAAAQNEVPAITVVVHPCDETSLRGAIEAAEEGLIVPVLVGPEMKIRTVAAENKLDLARYEIVDAPHSHAAAAKGVALIREGKGELLMKGSLHTDELMREVTSSSTGLRTSAASAMSSSWMCPTIADTAVHHRCGDQHLPRSRYQARHHAKRYRSLGTDRARQAARCHPVCRRNGDNQNPVDHRGGGAVQDGGSRPDHRRSARWPACLRQRDNPEAARIKGIASPVAGRAQILVVPDLEAGNMLAKNLIFFAHADAAGIVLGRAGADYPDVACGFRSKPPGILRCGRSMRPRRRRHGGAVA